jgi:predicted DNA-binding transcriptional regulator YafY
MDKLYKLEGLTVREAELIDVALSIAAANPQGHTDGEAYRTLQRKVEAQLEAQD